MATYKQPKASKPATLNEGSVKESLRQNLSVANKRSNEYDGVKTSGIKIRGTGAATKGLKARGPMA